MPAWLYYVDCSVIACHLRVLLLSSWQPWFQANYASVIYTYLAHAQTISIHRTLEATLQTTTTMQCHTACVAAEHSCKGHMSHV